jgi:hypothetical protein
MNNQSNEKRDTYQFKTGSEKHWSDGGEIGTLITDITHSQAITIGYGLALVKQHEVRAAKVTGYENLTERNAAGETLGNGIYLQVSGAASYLNPPPPAQWETITEESFTRVNSDSYGNPRYVIHYTNFITDKDRESYDKTNTPRPDWYAVALKRAKKIGGGKFNNKQYGGGIVFQSYNIATDVTRIQELVKSFE